MLLSLSIAAGLGVASHGANADGFFSGTHAKKHHNANKSQAIPVSYLQGTVKTSKTGMGVQLDYAFASATVDRDGLLQLTITRRAGGNDASIAIEPDAGLLMVEGLPSSPIAFNPGASYTLKIQALTDDLRYLNIFLKSAGQSESLAIAIQLGKDANLQKPGKVQTTPNGQRVISVPAQ